MVNKMSKKKKRKNSKKSKQDQGFITDLYGIGLILLTIIGCSPFGIKSLRQLMAINPDMIKIASPELNHFPMLEELCKLQKKRKNKIPVILSSGVSKEEDIKKAIEVFEKNNQKNQERMVLFH